MIHFIFRCALDGSDFNVVDASAGAFKTPAEMDQCFRMRARCTMALFEVMAAGASRATTEDFASVLATLTSAGEPIAFADLRTNKHEWVET